jgi:hypothetical protein
MSLLAPLFLLGAAGLLLPVVFHLARRRPTETTPFSSLMFLKEGRPRLTRRSRLEDLLLLVLRCLALLLLALAFARPFLPLDETAAGIAKGLRRTVVLVDQSASLRRDGLWEEAGRRVEAIVREAGPGDEVAVLAFARGLRTVVSFGDWAAIAPPQRLAAFRERWAEIGPTWEGTHLGAALAAAAELAADTADGGRREVRRRELVVVSDVQSGSRMEGLTAQAWPSDVRVRLESLRGRAGNAGIQVLPAAPGAMAARVRVTVAADAGGERLALDWAGGGAPIEVLVPPGQNRVVTLPRRPGAEAEERVVLRGDADAFDNEAWFAVPPRARLRLAYLGPEAEGDATQPLFFLRRALASTDAREVEIVRREGAVGDLGGIGALFASGPPAPADLPAVRAWAEAGGLLVIVPRTAEAAAAWGALWPNGTLGAEEARGGRYAMWGQIDYTHPVFAPFADARFSDFTRIRIWAHRRLDPAGLPGARVPARFDNGDPAVIEAPLGRGLVLVLASGWQPADSQLALSSKFVPLLWSMLEHGNVVRETRPGVTVGEPIAVDPAVGEATVVRPDGVRLALPEGARAVGTEMPGLHRVAGARGERTVLVALDPAESRTEPLAPEELEALGVPLAATTPAAPVAAAAAATLAAAEAEARQPLWRWFILATLVILLLEGVIAGRSGVRVSPEASS